MPDDDELENDGGEDPLMVEALLRWDGDSCDCQVCVCPLFLDRADAPFRRDCEAGNYTGQLQ